MQIRKRIIRLSVALSALFLALLFPVGALADENAAGWVSRSGKWYFYEKDGTLATNRWLKIGGNLYWLNDDGSMAKDMWLEREKKWFYLGSSGAAVSGWNEIDSKWYYFDKDSFTMASSTTIDSWYVGADGAWVPSK